jgi:cytochrome c oxidase assembly protein subunit 15
MARLFKIGLITALAIYLQLALGATMRHQHRDLAILDFPTANHQWIPDTSPQAIASINAWRDTQGLSDVTAFQIWLHMFHRFGAIVIAILVLMAWSVAHKISPDVPLVRPISKLLLLLVLCQIGLGAWTIWSNKAADIATTHVAVGATIFVLTIAFCAICYRLSHESGGTRAVVSQNLTTDRAAPSSTASPTMAVSS